MVEYGLAMDVQMMVGYRLGWPNFPATDGQNQLVRFRRPVLAERLDKHFRETATEQWRHVEDIGWLYW